MCLRLQIPSLPQSPSLWNSCSNSSCWLNICVWCKTEPWEMMVCIFPDAWENGERVQFSVWCYTRWHNLCPLSRYKKLASVFAPLFLLYFPIESLHLNLILREEHFPQECLFKGALFPEGFLREHWSPKRRGKLRFQKPKRALKEVISLLFYKCSGQFLFWLQFYLGVPMAAKTTQASFLGFQHHKSSLKGITIHKSQLTIISSRVQNFHQTVHVSLQKSSIEWKLQKKKNPQPKLFTFHLSSQVIISDIIGKN